MTDPAPPEPLSLMEAKLNLRIDPDNTDEDSLVAGLIIAARGYVEDCTGLVLTPRMITETAAMLGRWINLASWPVTNVTAIRYPAAGVMTALATGAWLVNLNRRPVRLLPASFGWGLNGMLWCAPGLPIEIDVSAGYATPSDVPQQVKQAMHLLIAHWYGNRSAAEVGTRAAAVDIPYGVDALLNRYRLRNV